MLVPFFIQCEHMYEAICESVTVIVMSNDGVAKCNNELSYNLDNVQKLSTVLCWLLPIRIRYRLEYGSGLCLNFQNVYAGQNKNIVSATTTATATVTKIPFPTVGLNWRVPYTVQRKRLRHDAGKRSTWYTVCANIATASFGTQKHIHRNTRVLNDNRHSKLERSRELRLCSEGTESVKRFLSTRRIGKLYDKI